MLAIGGFWLSQIQKSREERTTEDNQRETALQAYLDHMSDLLLGNNTGKENNTGKNPITLASAQEDHAIISVAQARTLAVLRQLDGNRRGTVIRFLSKSLSTSQLTNIIDLAGANLDAANLPGIDLSNAKLRHAWLLKSILRGANLSGADLSQSQLGGADLRAANLYGTNLCESYLGGACLNASKLTMRHAPVTE